MISLAAVSIGTKHTARDIDDPHLYDGSGQVTGYEVFADNFMLGNNETYNRRPVDLLVLPDGSLLVSDDQSHQIYRIWYEG